MTDEVYGPAKRLREIIATLRSVQRTSARNEWPHLWADALQTRRLLQRWFTACSDGGITGQALALMQLAARRANDKTARPDLVARGIRAARYAQEVLAAGGHREELDYNWLLERADED